MKIVLSHETGSFTVRRPNVRTKGTAMRLLTRRLAYAAGALVTIWIGLALGSAWFFTRRPLPMTPEVAPEVAWGKFESSRIKTADGEELGLWFLEGAPDAPTVLVLHGHGGCRSLCIPQAEIFAQAGCSVCMISMRASGDSTGNSSDVGFSARTDVVAAVDFIERRRPGKPVHIMGVSMGAAAAIYASGDVGARVSGYILESPYKDLRTAVRNRTELWLAKPWSDLFYDSMMFASPLFIGDVDRIAPIAHVKNIPASVPVVFLYGDLDSRARPEEIRALHDEIAAHATMVLFAGGAHLSLRHHQPELYRATLLAAVGRT